MYSRYHEYEPFIPMNNRLHKEEGRAVSRRDRAEREERERADIRHDTPAARPERHGLLSSFGAKPPAFLGNFLKNLNFDSGDILLILILIFMSMESDDDEILLLLGMVLLLGL